MIQYIITEYPEPDDFVPFVKEIKDPVKPLLRSIPTETKIMAKMKYSKEELDAMTKDKKEALEQSKLLPPQVHPLFPTLHLPAQPLLQLSWVQSLLLHL